eukprot:1175806-Prorocentrum_minimum.AAC.3
MQKHVMEMVRRLHEQHDVIEEAKRPKELRDIETKVTERGPELDNALESTAEAAESLAQEYSDPGAAFISFADVTPYLSADRWVRQRFQYRRTDCNWVSSHTSLRCTERCGENVPFREFTKALQAFFKQALPPPSSLNSPGLSARGLHASSHAEYKKREEEMERLRSSREVGEFQYILAQAQLSRQQYGLAAAKAASRKLQANTHQPQPPLFLAEQQVDLSALQHKAADLVASLKPVCARFARLQEYALFEQEFTVKLVRARCMLHPAITVGEPHCA